jgi:hypothetical protein
MTIIRTRTATVHAGGQAEDVSPPTTSTPVAVATAAPTTTRRRTACLRSLRTVIRDGDDVGMATAEYAIATVAAAGFAGILIALLRSDEVRGLLMGIVRGALSM